MAYLGPLPFVTLKKEYPYAKPLITFKTKNGTYKYRCVVAKFKKDKLDTTKPIKVALTQPLSTCGYLMTNILLQKYFHLDLQKQYYDYTMSHTNALLGALKGEFLLAGAKEDIAQKFDSLGMEIIAKSEFLPGFSLVINTKTVPKEVVEKLQKTLLKTPQEKYLQWHGIGRYGMKEAHCSDYKQLQVDFMIPQVGKMP
jgi:phosphonate transport system substrate-binding protein